MSGEPHAAIVEEVREPTVRLWSPIALLALVGGAAVTAGVFLPWAEATRGTLRTQDFLEGLASGFGLDPSAFPVTGDIQTVTGAVGGVSVTGRADLLGIGAAVAGFAAIVGAVLALGMPDPRMRRIGGVTAGVAGIAVILFAGSAWADTGGLVLKELVAQVRSAADQQLEALIPGIPFRGLITGPLLDRVESSLVAAVEVEARAGAGLFVSLGGGIAAILGGIAVVVREVPVEAAAGEGTLQQTVAQMDEADRTDLLHVLTSPEEARAEAVRSFTERPGKESWKGLLAELEHNARVRRDVVDALKNAQDEQPR